MTAREAAEAIRGHGAIENVCHGSLDVTLGEDGSRIAEGHAAENLSMVPTMVLAALKRRPERREKYGNKKLSVRQKRKICGWDHDVLVQRLCALF